MSARKKTTTHPLKGSEFKESEFKEYERKTYHTYRPGPDEEITLRRDGDAVSFSIHSGIGSTFAHAVAYADLTLADWHRLTELFYRALGDETE